MANPLDTARDLFREKPALAWGAVAVGVGGFALVTLTAKRKAEPSAPATGDLANTPTGTVGKVESQPAGTPASLQPTYHYVDQRQSIIQGDNNRQRVYPTSPAEPSGAVSGNLTESTVDRFSTPGLLPLSGTTPTTAPLSTSTYVNPFQANIDALKRQLSMLPAGNASIGPIQQHIAQLEAYGT